MGADARKSGNLPDGSGHGLRSRKKAKRREDILTSARDLFEHKGIQATTMAEIAEAVDVSPPTVFNYFGNKDGILIALITEGSTRSRRERGLEPRTDTEFGTALVDFLSVISRSTLKIADKRVWRYAEAASIRHPTTDLAQKYARNDQALRITIRDFLDQYNLRLHGGGVPDTDLMARLIFDIWNAAFFDLIKTEDMPMSRHVDEIGKRFLPLCAMWFDPDFLKNPTLKTGSDPNADS